ncbi:MAG: glycosyltransferase family 4 protein [Candidatus Paceibacterota bacterium]|jgi:glycosyltransferase involved in cell wall biosynthesis
MKNNTSQTNKKSLFLIYLGKSLAKFTFDFTKAVEDNLDKIDCFRLLISDSNLLKEGILEAKKDSYMLTTPLTLSETILKLPNFIIKSIKIIKKKKKEKERFVFLMTHVWNPFFMILIKILSPRSKIFYVSHDANVHPGEKNSRLQYLIMQIEILLSNKIITLSDNVKSTIQKRWPNKQIVILEHPMYDFGKISETRKLGNIPTFLFFGRMIKYKGLNLFLQAIKIFDTKMKEFNKKYKVIIAGEGQIEDEDVLLINEINEKDKNIDLINKYIEEKDISKIWGRSDVCVLPYIEASQSGVIAIAINKGMPCIITPVTGLLEQCKVKTKEKAIALISREISPAAFSEKMVEILNEDKYEYLSRNIIESQQDLGWRKWIEEIIK